ALAKMVQAGVEARFRVRGLRGRQGGRAHGQGQHDDETEMSHGPPRSQDATASPAWRAATEARLALAGVRSPAAAAFSMASTHPASHFLPARKRSRPSATSNVMALE